MRIFITESELVAHLRRLRAPEREAGAQFTRALILDTLAIIACFIMAVNLKHRIPEWFWAAILGSSLYFCTWLLVRTHTLIRASETLREEREPAYAWVGSQNGSIVYATEDPRTHMEFVPEYYRPAQERFLRIGGGQAKSCSDRILIGPDSVQAPHDIKFYLPDGEFYPERLATIQFRPHGGNEQDWTPRMPIELAIRTMECGIDLFRGYRKDGNGVYELNIVNALMKHTFEGRTILEQLHGYGTNIVELFEQLVCRIADLNRGWQRAESRREETFTAIRRLREATKTDRDVHPRPKATRTTINFYNREHVALALAYIELRDTVAHPSRIPTERLDAFGFTPEQIELLEQRLYAPQLELAAIA